MGRSSEWKNCPGEKLPVSVALSDHIKLATELLACCRGLSNIKGMQKLERSISTEMKFFHSLSSKDVDKQAAQLQSTNLGHFAAIVHAAAHLPGVTGVMERFTSPDRPRSLEVDVVALGGRSWVKVVARKGRALHHAWEGSRIGKDENERKGQGQFGEKNMVQQLIEYKEVSSHHPLLFTTRTLYALFYNGVTKVMASALQEEGVRALGHQMSVSCNDQCVPEKAKCEEGEEEGGDDHHDSEEKEEEGGLGKEDDDGDDDLVCDGDEDAGDDLVCDGDEDAGEASDLEMDSAQDIPTALAERMDTREEDARERKAGTSSAPSSSSSSAWLLSPQAQRCLEGILSSYPDLGLFGDAWGSAEAEDEEGEGVVGVEGRKRVNLDTTTLITLVSAVCHGDGCNFQFQDKALNQQAEEERRRRTLSDLNNFLEDKEWIVCFTAWQTFSDIVQKLGGPNERKRADELLDKVKLVEDQPSARASSLDLKGKVKDKPKVVFGTGDQIQAVTVTANTGFIRAAENQNVFFAVHVHPPRALTELKQETALSEPTNLSHNSQQAPCAGPDERNSASSNTHLITCA